MTRTAFFPTSWKRVPSGILVTVPGCGGVGGEGEFSWLTAGGLLAGGRRGGMSFGGGEVQEVMSEREARRPVR